MASVYDFEASPCKLKKGSSCTAEDAENHVPEEESDYSEIGSDGEEIIDGNTEDGSDLDQVSPAPSDDDDHEGPEEDLRNSEEAYLPVWTTNFQEVNVPYFTAPTGHKLPDDFALDEATPLDFFMLYFTNNLFADIVKYTNEYAQWSIRAKGDRYRDIGWKRDGSSNTTLPEVKAYFGILIMCGVSPANRVKQYWSSDPFLNNAGVSAVMARNRFEKISQYFHVSDRRREPGKNSPSYDRLFKIRPVIEQMSKLFPKYQHPAPSQTIDEGMVAFKGRVSYLQYMPAKPIKRGLKVFIRCDSETGYMHQFEVYLGKSRTTGPQGLYFDVVDNLTKPIRGQNHRLYTDNLYTSITLWKHLFQHGIFATGTIRKHRKGLPAEVRENKKLLRGEYRTYQDVNFPNLTATVWADNRVVRYCSTMAKPSLRMSTMRRIGATYHRMGQPHAGVLYAKHMGGVDRFDQLRAKYRVGRFSKKSWKYLFNFLLTSAIVNAWILYSSYSRRKVKKTYDQNDFRLELAKELIGGYSYRDPKPTQLYMGPVDPVNVAAHVNTHMGSKWNRQCHTHTRYYGQNIRKRTAFGCKQCGVHLCKDCHYLFHGQIN